MDTINSLCTGYVEKLNKGLYSMIFNIFVLIEYLCNFALMAL